MSRQKHVNTARCCRCNHGIFPRWYSGYAHSDSDASEIATTSSSVKSKSKRSKFSRMRRNLRVAGITTAPRSIPNRRRICCTVRFFSWAALRTAGNARSRRPTASPRDPALVPPRLPNAMVEILWSAIAVWTLVEKFDIEPLPDFSAKWANFRGSFSSVSTPFFASKYSLESSWRHLQDVHTFAPLRSRNFSRKSSTFFREWINEFQIVSFFVSNFWWNFIRISRQIPEKSDVCF